MTRPLCLLATALTLVAVLWLAALLRPLLTCTAGCGGMD
jgi:hypothetical protein